jgi:hypothetical protein
MELALIKQVGEYPVPDNTSRNPNTCCRAKRYPFLGNLNGSGAPALSGF